MKSFVIFLGENCEIQNFPFFLLCFKKGKTHASRLSCFIICTFIWLLNPTNCFFPIRFTPFVCLLCYFQTCFTLPLLLVIEHSRNDPEPCVFVTQPLPAARKLQFVMLCCSLTLYTCQLVLVLWNTEWEQCRLCHERNAHTATAPSVLAVSLQGLVIEIYAKWGNKVGALCWEVFVLLCFSSASEVSQGKSWRLLEGEDETLEVRWV